jgi:hypothetical protein
MLRSSLVFIGCASVLAMGCGDDSPVVDDDTSTSNGSTSAPLDDSTTADTSTTSDGQTEDGSSGEPTTTGLDSSTGPDIVCGNDVLEADEVCDGDELAGEDCESQGFVGGTLACADDCAAFDTRGCISAAACGNGSAEADELCDGNDLAGASCRSEGFDSGTLACDAGCQIFDTSECGTCGNVIVDGDEPCDDVALLGQTCQSQGFDSGQIACLADCTGFDTSPCGTCENGLIDGDELCDSGMLAGQTCVSAGFDSGTLACGSTCLTFDTTGCGVCGNGVADGDEVCDGLDVAGQTCVSAGFDSGTLACAAGCGAVDTSSCGNCGNGVIDGAETCDGLLLGGETCESLGLVGGTLACLPSCQRDISGCELQSGSLLTVRTGDGMLRAIDPITHALTDIGPLGAGFDFGDLAWDGTTATLWMIDGRPLEALYTVNVNTGAASLVGIHGVEDLFGLAFDTSTGTLYGSGESPTGLYTMNQLTGMETFIGDPLVAADGLTYDSLRDQLVGLEAGGGELNLIDRVTGAPTLLSSQGFINNCGLAYDPFLDLYWAIDWSGDLYTYDPNAGYTRTLVVSVLEAHDGLTYVPGFVP